MKKKERKRSRNQITCDRSLKAQMANASIFFWTYSENPYIKKDHYAWNNEGTKHLFGEHTV